MIHPLGNIQTEQIPIMKGSSKKLQKHLFFLTVTVNVLSINSKEEGRHKPAGPPSSASLLLPLLPSPPPPPSPGTSGRTSTPSADWRSSMKEAQQANAFQSMVVGIGRDAWKAAVSYCSHKYICTCHSLGTHPYTFFHIILVFRYRICTHKIQPYQDSLRLLQGCQKVWKQTAEFSK